MKSLIFVSLFLLSLTVARAQSGNRVLALSGTNTTSDWSLQKLVTYSLTGDSTNTHSNIPTTSTIKTLYEMRVSGNGTRTLDFVFPGGVTTNWVTEFVRTPRNGQTTFIFEQYGSTVDISALPDVFASADGQILGRDGGRVQFASPSTFGIGGVASSLYNGTLVTVSNTVTETAIYTNATAISANILGTNKTMLAVLQGDILNNTGGTSNFTVRAYVGTTRVVDGGFSIAAGGANRMQVQIEVRVCNLNSTASQKTWLRLVTGAPNNTFSTSGIFKGPVATVSTENTTASLPFSVTITPGHAVGTMVWDNYHTTLSFP